MFSWTRKSSSSSSKAYNERRRFEHWYRDNQVYFITARCRGRFRAFASEQTKEVFWDRFEHYTQNHLFTPWVTSLMDNHYHVLGYCETGELLGPMMRKIHGSVAKLTNDLLPERLVPFWREAGHQDYFDGCIRDEKQCRLAYRYVRNQSVRHGLCSNWSQYRHTHINIELERAVRRALELGAFMENVPYRRYQ
ncbi:MAG: transposase [Planctomycetota bacterium]|nr:transposase [Planctomycetota bacterium]